MALVNEAMAASRSPAFYWAGPAWCPGRRSGAARPGQAGAWRGSRAFASINASSRFSRIIRVMRTSPRTWGRNCKGRPPAGARIFRCKYGQANLPLSRRAWPRHEKLGCKCWAVLDLRRLRGCDLARRRFGKGKSPANPPLRDFRRSAIVRTPSDAIAGLWVAAAFFERD